MRRAGLLATLSLLALGAFATAQAEDLATFHFALSKSAPEEGTTSASPSEIRLWFTQVPQEGTVSIRVLDAGEQLVATADVVQDAEDGSVFSVQLRGTLPDGQYTVAWRGMGQDGHVVRGDFAFVVAAP